MWNRGDTCLPRQEGENENEQGVIPSFHGWNKGCEQILYQVSSADVEETDAADSVEIGLCCPLLK